MPVSQAARPKIVTTAPIGSTTPESTPPKACPCSPSARRGIEMMAPLREILDGYAEGQGQRARRGDLCAACEKAGVHHTDCHALRDVVQGHCQHHHRSAAQPAFGPSASSLPTCRWGNQMIQGKQNSTPNQNPANAGKKANRPTSQTVRLPGSAGSRPMPPPSHRRQSLQVGAAPDHPERAA